MAEPASRENSTGRTLRERSLRSADYVSITLAAGAVLFAFNIGRGLPDRTEVKALELRVQTLERGGPRFSSTDAEQMEQELREWVSLRFKEEVPRPVVMEKLDSARKEIERLKSRQRETEQRVWSWKPPCDFLQEPSPSGR